MTPGAAPPANGRRGPRLAVLVTRARPEDRAVLETLSRRGVDFEIVLDGRVGGQLEPQQADYDAVLVRSLSYVRGLYGSRYFESRGAQSINCSSVIATCGDKLLTSLALVANGIPTPPTSMALGSDAALEAMAAMGYPVVLKPVVGSWGRLLAKVDDPVTAQAFLEHREYLPGPIHAVVYVQKYVDKPGRDIRSVVIGDQVVGAIYRYSEHWITNTGRGGEARDCPLTAELVDLSLRAAHAVGGGALAVDLMESPDGLLVTEVNHSMEFRNMTRVNGVDYAGRLVDYVQEQVGLACAPV